ncbi:MAG: hypothetical protein JKY56_14740 [Kofleriaceae bacterium]|nr:hypothetical protein [Kofleriaceae bacterium]
MAAQKVICTRCGASTPILGADLRCLYCLATIVLPSEVAQPLAEHQALGQKLSAQSENFAAARSGMSGEALSLFIIGFFLFVIIGGSGLFGLYKSGGDIPTSAMPMVIIMGVGYGGFIVALLGGGMRSMYVTRKRLAVLPFANLLAGTQLSAACANCGGTIVAKAHAIAASCEHCNTESLLPAAMVSKRLQAKHRLVLVMKQELGDVSTSSSNASSSFYGNTLVVSGVVLGFGMIFYFLVIADKPPHLQGAQYWLAAIMPGLVVGGLVSGFGLLNLRHSRDSEDADK